MNREQRRKATREFIKKGYTPQQAQAATALLAGRLSRKYLKEGEKVRLNGPALLSAYTANRLSEPFMAFVRQHLGSTLTVEYDPEDTSGHRYVQLQEDESPVKWLVWEGYLDRVDEEKP